MTAAGMPADLEIVPLALDPEAEILKPARQPHPKRRLEIRGIALQHRGTGRPSSGVS